MTMLRSQKSCYDTRYEDVRLLVVHSSDNSEGDVLAMEVKLSHHKGHNKRPKP